MMPFDEGKLRLNAKFAASDRNVSPQLQFEDAIVNCLHLSGGHLSLSQEGSAYRLNDDDVSE